jgi:hypothetical protein
MDLRTLQRALGGDISNDQLLCPGPDHSAEDRSLSIKLNPNAPDGFVVHSFAGDDAIACRDHVRRKLRLPEFKNKEKKKNDKRNGAGKPAWSPIIDRYVYRQPDGTPYLQVPDRCQRVFPEQVERANVGHRQAAWAEDTVSFA